MANAQTPLFRPVQYLADLLDVSDQAIHGWIKRGAIKALRLGHTVRIPQSEIDRILTEGFPKEFDQQEDQE